MNPRPLTGSPVSPVQHLSSVVTLAFFFDPLSTSLDHILALGITVCALTEYFECVTLAALTERGQAIHARSLITVHRSAAAQTDVAVGGGAVGT